ncbi:hypothetical protein B4168_3366 [Anoxybacillus flavithermus]|nr:hypothetical protein B4168_3366 [Anoxybacillus flavithermus]OAO85062.1 hypothetical protein GT23_3116 [Parageobacillus thermoglucosidasius]
MQKGVKANECSGEKRKNKNKYGAGKSLFSGGVSRLKRSGC